MSHSTALATPPAPSTGCRLATADGRDLPLRDTALSADAASGLARVRVVQTFVNPYAEPLAVTYLLPLPADGAVTAFAFTVAGRRVTGRVERREDARRTFEQALLEGRTAALLEQDRSSVFTQELGNVPPGAEVRVEIDVEQPLAWVRGGWEWRFPTVVGPRYLGAPGETPDAARLVVDVAPAVPARARVVLAIGDATTGPAASPSHALAAAASGVALDGPPDRDVVVWWPVAAPLPGVGLETARGAADVDAFGLLTLVPPAAAGAPVRRDLCLLLDTSGSMGGRPLAQLRAFATALVAGLRDGDSLEMIEFSSAPHRWRPAPVTVDARARLEASGWLASLRASGGTAMHEAVTAALAPLSVEAQRQVVLMTDGYIGFEQEVIGRIRRGLPPAARIHVVGVGSAVNRTLTSGVARAGGGAEVVVGLDEDPGPAVAALLARTGDPLWVDVRVTGSAVREVAPAAVPDLLAGAPARVSLRLDPAGGTVSISARTAEGTTVRELAVAPVAAGHGRRVVITRYARERVEDWENAVAGGADAATADAAIEALGLRHQLATRRTSWVAVSDEATVDPADPTRRVTQPHLLPHGTSAEGVGLAAAPMVAQALGGAAADTGRLDRARRSSAAPTAAPAGPPPAKSLKKEAREEPAPRRLARPAADTESAAKPPPAPIAASAPAAVRRRAEAEEAVERDEPARVLVARVVSSGDGRLVLEVTLDEDTDWSPAPIEVVDADGRSVRTGPVAGTTRAGRLSAGLTVRLVFGWTGPLPAAVRVSGRTLLVAA
jgi:Ca-activated chloride channel family protein